MSQNDTERFREILIAHNYHVTKAREATFMLLVHSEPQSIRDLLIKSNGAIDRVTIYRNIELFEKLGIVHRVNVGWKYKLELSDDFVAHHHHLSCLDCGKIIDIEDEQHVDDFIHEVAERFGFEPRRHQFEIEGYCSGCRQAIKS